MPDLAHRENLAHLSYGLSLVIDEANELGLPQVVVRRLQDARGALLLVRDEREKQEGMVR